MIILFDIFLILISLLCFLYIAAGLLYILQREFQITVPTIKTNTEEIYALIKDIPINSGDTIIDLGSGNGSALFAFERKTDASIIGYELGIVPYYISLIKKRMIGSRLIAYRKNFINADLSNATLIYAYLSSAMMQKLAITLKHYIEQGIIIISCDFPLPFEPSRIIRNKKHVFYLYKKD